MSLLQFTIFLASTILGLFAGYYYFSLRSVSLKKLKIIFFSLIIFWVGWLLLLAIRKFLNLETQAIDFVLYDNSIWNTAHGRFFYTPLRNTSYLGTHFSPILLLFVPLYLLFYSPYWLLLAQAGALGCAAIPLFYYAKKLLKNDMAAFFIAGAWLMVPGIQWINTAEFHSACLQPVLIFLLFFSMQREKPVLIILTSFFLLLTREDASLFIAAASFYLFFRYKTQRKLAFLLFVASLLWFFAATKFWIPLVTGKPIGLKYQYMWLYRWLGNSYPAIAKTVLTNPLLVLKQLFEPERLPVYAKLFLPFCGISFLGGWTLIPLFLAMGMNFLSIYPHQHLLLIHYPAVIYSFLFIASVEGIRVICSNFDRLKTGLSCAAFSGFLSAAFFWGLLPFSQSFPWHMLTISPHAKSAQEFFTSIPEHASVGTQNSLMPHVSNRKEVYLVNKLDKEGFPRLYYGNYKGYPHSGVIPEYILLDRFTLFYPIKDIDMMIVRLLSENNYQLAMHNDGLFLFKRGTKNNIVHQEIFEESLLRMEAEHYHRQTGKVIYDKEAENGSAVYAKSKKQEKGYLVFGTYRLLDPGVYTVIFYLKGEASAASIDISKDKGTNIITRKDCTFPESLSRYQKYTLSFSLAEKTQVECRVFYHGFGSFYVDRIDIRSPELTLEKEYERRIKKKLETRISKFETNPNNKN